MSVNVIAFLGILAILVIIAIASTCERPSQPTCPKPAEPDPMFKISPSVRGLLLAHPDVKCFTERHIVLSNGSVVEPFHFVVRDEPVLFVMRLSNCHCGEHKAGMIQIVRGRKTTYADGNEDESCWDACQGICRNGSWETQETIRPDDPNFAALSEQANPPR